MPLELSFMTQMNLLWDQQGPLVFWLDTVFDTAIFCSVLILTGGLNLALSGA